MTLKVNKTAMISLKNTKLNKNSIDWYSTDPAVASVSTDGKYYIVWTHLPLWNMSDNEPKQKR